MEKRYSIGKVAELTGLSTQTLRRWDNENIFNSDYQSEVSGKRYYSQISLNKLLNKTSITKSKNRLIIGYCRVSKHHQKDDLERQIKNMETYLMSKGKPFKILSDIGSGINYNNKNLLKLLEMINNDEVEAIVVLYKDRLVRFGFELIEKIASLHDVKIEIVDNTERTFEEELSMDLIQIITVFSSKINGRRSGKTKKLLEEVIANENSKNS